MSQQTSEDKSLPASTKKLADARRKGQVAHSRDLVTVVALVAGFLYLGVEGPAIMEAFRAILTEPIALTAKPFDQSYTIMPTLLALAARIVAPLVLVIVVASVLANVGFLRGIPFSIDPLVPRGDKINPVAGFQRLFSLRNLLEFIKAVVKACTLIGVIGLLALAALRAVLVTPQCGRDCIGLVLVATLKPVLIGIIAVLLVFALIDMMLQRWLFQRDQRMTRSEMKRERKEQDGDPFIRSTRRQLHRGLARGEGQSSAPTLFVTDGETTVGIRFVAGETSVPILVSKSFKGGMASVPMETAPLLARQLQADGKIGEAIPAEHFDALARILLRIGAV
ncbi:EscU/YscU/HrcU family type III secretion system export apparatus switch protein [Mycobacterium sp. KBS0706]|uniref:EscU/YscU/HrcU family type III secretion system export apparatus switch protein n=1 Tax=Mycobacterium sp. KBS0706 TaxID=2578109 RepID=UPI00110FEA9F|nr:EscU/YscU/HrcU family type III secretion system export apparatus switch protein [Mycobacterium sp. KBS0706]TSD85762.1 EscU/YscU/HrcU family type III secretion system export apparatus switch protein [Mycobacterium sp. KBS0706]